MFRNGNVPVVVRHRQLMIPAWADRTRTRGRGCGCEREYGFLGRLLGLWVGCGSTGF